MISFFFQQSRIKYHTNTNTDFFINMNNIMNKPRSRDDFKDVYHIVSNNKS